jgi:TolA-binding protein
MKTFTLRSIAILLALGATLGAQSNSEELARRQYDSGRAFMQDRRYSEALKDFQAVIDSFARSSVADNALLQVALYQLEVAHDISMTQSVIDRLLKEYPDTDSAPMAYVVSGRLSLAKGRTPAEVDAALASFERVPRLFPGDEAVPAAGFYAGETLRLVRRTDEALERFRRVAMEYPRSPWAARANLAAGYCLVQSDRGLQALQEIQRVRQLFPGTDAAADALNLNTILYRLYVRAPAQPAYGFSGRSLGPERSGFDDVVGVAIDPIGRVLLGHKNGVAVFDGKGAMTNNVGAQEPSAFFLDERGRIVVVRRDSFIVERGETTLIATPTQEGKPKPVEEMPAVVAMSTGDRLVADNNARVVIRVSPSGRYIGNFTNTNASRLALNRLDDVAMIDRSSKGIVILDRDGKPLGKIAPKGSGYEFDEPVDLAYDSFGHLYVLDRGRASVFIFGPKNRLITTVTIPEKSPGAFTRAAAFALDPAGRLNIFDERAKRVQVYQ